MGMPAFFASACFSLAEQTADSAEWMDYCLDKGLANKAYSDAKQADSAQRVLASVQVSGSDYNKITTSGNKQSARYVFFAGCNVYFQPEKILNALDIMDAIGDDYTFLPGLDYCCGDSHLFMGGMGMTQSMI